MKVEINMTYLVDKDSEKGQVRLLKMVKSTISSCDFTFAQAVEVYRGKIISIFLGTAVEAC